MPAFSPPAEIRPAGPRSSPRAAAPRPAVIQDIPDRDVPQAFAEELTGADRFQLLEVIRGINGVVSARLRDRKTNQEYKIAPYDGLETFVITDIDFTSQSVTLVDGQMQAQTIAVGK
jgi:hypothetical protein